MATFKSSPEALFDVTTLLWLRQDGRQFWAQPANFDQLKKQFSLIVCEKKSAVFPSKVQTLFLSKNITYENFFSVALQYYYNTEDKQHFRQTVFRRLNML